MTNAVRSDPNVMQAVVVSARSLVDFLNPLWMRLVGTHRGNPTGIY